MADWPLKELNGRTPLEAARTPNMDYIAKMGRCGLLKTLQEDMPYGSDVANLAILGYDPRKYYAGGRGPLEAASKDITLKGDDIALRCNLITEENGIIKDHSGGHISSEEGRQLINSIKKEMDTPEIEFVYGTGYRNLLILRSGKYSADICCIPPHDIIGQNVKENSVKPLNDSGKATSELLNNLMTRSKNLLEKHPINLKRKKEGKTMANMLWFWGVGRRLNLPDFRERFGLSGVLISAVDLLKGLAKCIGFDVIDVPGATGYLDTDYEGKADAALNALETRDLVYVHVEAPDEAGHEGSIEKKIKAIEDLDSRLIGRLLNELKDNEFTIAVLPDHATPIAQRTHTIDPVPFAIYSPHIQGDNVNSYDEKSVKEGYFGIREGKDFINILLNTE